MILLSLMPKCYACGQPNETLIRVLRNENDNAFMCCPCAATADSLIRIASFAYEDMARAVKPARKPQRKKARS